MYRGIISMSTGERLNNIFMPVFSICSNIAYLVIGRTHKMLDSVIAIVGAMDEMARVLDSNKKVVFANRQFKNEFGANYDKTLPEGNRANRVFENGDCELNGKIYQRKMSKILYDNGQKTAIIETYEDVSDLRITQTKLKKKNVNMEEQMELALRIQRALLPRVLPNTEPFSFHSGFKPCEKVGGDLYDVFDMGKGHYAFYIADASGHGIMAAMLTVFVKQSARAYLKNEDYSPSKILNYICKMFKELDLEPEIYITMFFGVLDVNENVVTYANAGHNCVPLMYDGEKITELLSPSVPICRWFEEPGYCDEKVKIPKGGTLLLHTDGLTDCFPRSINDDIIKRMLVISGSGKQFVENMMEMVEIEEVKCDMRDDMAILLLEHCAVDK